MGSITVSNANARLSYSLNGSHIAKLRVSKLSHSYGVVAQESHARRFRAFYPHLRVQGTFSVTLDCIHWREFNQAMGWFHDYVNGILNWKNPSAMQVSLDARNFVRLGVPVSGITFGDHTASMLFNPTITFISVADPRDPNSDIRKLEDQASRSRFPKTGDLTSTKWFYPESAMNSPGKLQDFLYDQAAQDAAAAAAEIQDTITGPTPGAPVRGGGVGIE